MEARRDAACQRIIEIFNDTCREEERVKPAPGVESLAALEAVVVALEARAGISSEDQIKANPAAVSTVKSDNQAKAAATEPSHQDPPQVPATLCTSAPVAKDASKGACCLVS